MKHRPGHWSLDAWSYHNTTSGYALSALWPPSLGRCLGNQALLDSKATEDLHAYVAKTSLEGNGFNRHHLFENVLERHWREMLKRKGDQSWQTRPFVIPKKQLKFIDMSSAQKRCGVQTNKIFRGP